MNQYVRITEGLNDKGKLILPSDISSYIKKEKDYYTSLYYYDDEQLSQFKLNMSVKGFKDVKTDHLYFDFDSENHIEKAREDTLVLAQRLITRFKIDPNSVRCFYTGKKGFSLKVYINEILTPEQFKMATFKLAGDLETFDKVVNDPNRLIRVANTKHQVSGLYKIPLFLYELDELSVEQIKQLAKQPRDIEYNDEKMILDKELFQIVKLKETKQKSKYELNLTNKPNQWKNCKWSLLQGNFGTEPGQRHTALIVLAATSKALGYDKETTYYLCKSALKKQASVTGRDEFSKEELWSNIIEESVFKEGWEGGQYTCRKEGWLQDYCNSLGEHSCKDSDHDELQPCQIFDIQVSFKDYVLNIEKNTIKTGIRPLDEKLPLTIGNNCAIVGAPASGKTALALEILKNTSKAGVVSVFASLDMHRNRLFEKLLYKVSGGMSREDVYRIFQEGKESELVDKIKEEYGNVYFYDRSSPTVKDIRSYIETINATGKTVKLVMVDYFERVNSDKSEDTAASKDIAGKLQDLINDYNICLVTLVQPNKVSLSGGPESPILNYTAIKGSSYLYQSFRSIVSIWRPFAIPSMKDKDKYLQMAILKNDLGELDLFNFGFEGKTGKIYELAEEQEEQLNYWLKEKEEAGKKKESDWE